MSSPDIAGILDSSKELDRLRKEQEDVLIEINKMHKKLISSGPEVVEKAGDSSLSKLKMLYIQAKELSESEVSISSQLLGQLDALMPSGTQGQHRRRIGSEQKKKRVKADSEVPRLSPSRRSHLESLASLKGEQVAARITQENSGKDEWFVVKVIHFDKETREFEVLDEDPGEDEESTVQRKYKLPMSHIIPFPKRSDLSNIPEFPSGRNVLAVYPETTALYKATVYQNRKRKIDDYVVQFEDDEEDGSLPKRVVPFHRVVALPDGCRQ
ncbi:SAGA-associated factor 29 A, variant 2 [Salvia divinorum]|uniref:SAGA-associated factor 29 A, variant 2 n=1 Tax=Salvia divinorum TaxID=28513 RepID=A0ABD1I684_SALDI